MVAAPRSVGMLLIAILALPLIQMIPLPPGIWNQLPGREVASQVLGHIGAGDNWHPITLDLWATLFGWLMLIPPTVMFLAVFTMERGTMRLLVIALALLGFLSLLVGMFQFTSSGNLFNFYNTKHRQYMVGFFANRNHQAMFIACSALFGIGIVFRLVSDRGKALLSCLLISFLAFGAIVATGSRSGILLTGVAIIISVVFNTGLGKRPWITISASAVATIVAFAVLQSSSGVFEKVFNRYGEAIEDDRWSIWEVSWDIVAAFFPAGSGLGTYVPVYKTFETLGTIVPSFVNHAHNDYLELLTEFGALFVIVFLWFLVMFARALKRTSPWKTGGMPAAATMVILILLAHSVVDYPLRTSSISVIFAMGVAILFRGDFDAMRQSSRR